MGNACASPSPAQVEDRLNKMLPARFDLRGMTPLLWAAVEGDEDTVAALLEGGASLEKTAFGGWTPLMMASYNGRTDVVEMLLRPPGREVGADHTAKNNLGKTALEYAEQYGTAKSILLRSRAPSRRARRARGLLQIDRTGNNWAGETEVVDRRLPSNASEAAALLGRAAGDGRAVGTPLSAAVKAKDAARVRDLIQGGADPDATDDATTPLMHAAANDRANLVQTLLRGGADYSAQDLAGDTAEDYAPDGSRAAQVLRRWVEDHADVDDLT